MRVFSALKIGALIAACVCAQGQAPPSKDAPAEAKGIPPRAAASDYLTHGQAGAVTIAAEFTGHAVPTAQGPLSSEDYVAVETAFYGAPGARLTISSEDFSLRVNGKKAPLASVPYGSVFASLKDPEWVPPDAAAAGPKSKTSLGGGGQQGDSNEPPPPVKIPVEVRRAMSQRVQKAALPGGDRPLPQAGLIFFQYRGKTTGIHSLELIYAGPAGKMTVPLEP